jgi:phosphoribosylamine--glycine ligase
MRAGHHVKLCPAFDQHTKGRVKTGDGLVEKIENESWQDHAKWADLIVLSDNDKWLKQLDLYKKKGYPVFAPSWESAQLELDREQGQNFFKKHGIKVMPYESFTDYRKAEKYVRKEMKRFVSKPNNNQARELSYVSKSPADMVFMLERWADLGEIKGEFMLQEFVKGVEVGVSGWLGPKGFCSHFEEFFEHKTLMNDGKYLNTGETGTACKYVTDSALAKELLLPLERDLIKMGHVGSVAVGVIVDEEGDPRPLEFTMRLGWPSFNLLQPVHPDPCEWMVHLIDGEDTFEPLTDHVVGVVVFQPPFPFDDFIMKCGGKVRDETEGIPLYGMDDANEYRDYLSPCDVMEGTAPTMEGETIVDKRQMVSTGDYLLVASGCADTVTGAIKDAYKAIDSVEIPNSIGYRTDIGKRLSTDLPILQAQGFCGDWTYS